MGVVGVAATAKVVSNRTQARQREAANAPTAPVAPANDDMVAQLEKLADLKTSGILSEEEFTVVKAKLILGS